MATHFKTNLINNQSIQLLCIPIFMLLSHVANAVVPLPTNFTDLPVDQQISLEWHNMEETIYTGELPTEVPSLAGHLLNPADMAKGFCPVGQLLASRHGIKVPHTYGSTALFKWIPSPSSPFTGIYRQGGEGILRISNPVPGAALTSYAVGMALKVYNLGASPVSFHVMHSLTGQGSNRNPFANDFTNVLPYPGFLVWLGSIPGFEAARFWIDHPPENARTLPLNEAAAVGLTPSETLSIPFENVFTPSDHAKNLIAENNADDLRVQLKAVKAGGTILPLDILFSVKARTRDGEFTDAGTIVLKSEFIPTQYGDAVWYAKHQARTPCL